MVKIKVSYTERQELQKVLAVLKPYTLKVKKSQNHDGVYKKAYVDMDVNMGRSSNEHTNNE